MNYLKWMLTAFIVLVGVFIGTKYLKPDYVVKVDKQNIYYVGKINFAGVIDTVNLFSKTEIKPLNLVISSMGGEIQAGIEFGKFVHAQKLNVIVKEYCHSSCANYVFAAGNKRYVDSVTDLWFHTGDRDIYHYLNDYLRNGKKVFQQDCGEESKNTKGVSILVKDDSCASSELIDRAQYLFTAVDTEIQFYRRINVDPLLPYYGKILLDELCVGNDCVYYYSEKAFKNMGISLELTNKRESNLGSSVKDLYAIDLEAIKMAEISQANVNRFIIPTTSSQKELATAINSSIYELLKIGIE